jgi:hypothetical protein
MLYGLFIYDYHSDTIGKPELRFMIIKKSNNLYDIKTAGIFMSITNPLKPSQDYMIRNLSNRRVLGFCKSGKYYTVNEYNRRNLQ